MPRIPLLVAEDTTLLRKLLIQQLAREADLEVVGEAADGREAVELAERLRPRVVLMDLRMPGWNGIQATERILARRPETRVILLTAHEDLASLGRLSGACECLVKGCTPQELVAAIRRAAAAPGRAQPEIACRSAGGGRGADPPARLDAAIESLALSAGLTEREKRTLRHVVGTERTLAEIARVLAAEGGRPVSESAVKHALERVMTKLRIEPRTRAALVKRVLAACPGAFGTPEWTISGGRSA